MSTNIVFKLYDYIYIYIFFKQLITELPHVELVIEGDIDTDDFTNNAKLAIEIYYNVSIMMYFYFIYNCS